MNSPNSAHPASPLGQPDNLVLFKPPSVKPQPAVTLPGPSRLERLVALEADIRRQHNISDLSRHAVNAPLGLVGYDQAFHLSFNLRQKLTVVSCSSAERKKLHAPLLQAIAADVALLSNVAKPGKMTMQMAGRIENYPFANGYWSPFLDANGKCFGGLLFVRSTAFTENDEIVAAHIGQTYAHAFRALSPPSLWRSVSVPRWLLLSMPLALLALFFVPVPMTSSATFEVIAKDPAIVTASIDGAIADVLVEPNHNVKKGDVLFRFDTTLLQADEKIAQHRLLVAEARLAAAKNSDANDLDAVSAIVELQTSVDLALTEHEYASDYLDRATVKAEASGLLIYSSKSDWLGRRVQVGEKIMEIVDPALVEYRADLAVQDVITLKTGDRVKLFLDADPLNPRTGKIADMSYHAVQTASGVLAYRVRVKPDIEIAADRIGLRGVAQISSETVSLGFSLFRRPIAALRQYFGI